MEELDNEELKHAMSMPGGGPFRLDPGQVTDDSELAMFMMWGLLNSDKHVLKEGFQTQEGLDKLKSENKVTCSIESIASSYKDWVSSPPFDIGNTTRGTIGKLRFVPKARTAILAARNEFQNSLSNGSLMRLSPMAVYCAGLKELENCK